MAGTFLGCIADDFTGATDLAGILRRSGVSVSLRTHIPEEAAAAEETQAVEIIALKCRTARLDEAIGDVDAALKWLQKAGARRFFWKYCSTFDSTAKGNIGPIAEHMMTALGVAQTIYCPAFPQNGRSIFMGNLFVGEQPLHESPMKDHPLTPMRDSNLMRLLEPQVTRPVGLANRLVVEQGADALAGRLAALEADGVAYVVVDAVSNDDLTVIAEACADMAMLTGGSAVAGDLPRLYGLVDGDEQGSTLDFNGLGEGQIVLCGSCSAMTRKQVAAYVQQAVAHKLDPLELAQNGASAALDWLSKQDISAPKIIYATAEPEDVAKVQKELGVEAAGALVEDALSQLAVVARDSGIGRIVVAGGETSGAVTKALDVGQMLIGPEIAPGVPWTRCRSAGRDIALALKSGNFGAETFFTDAVDLLERA